MKENMEQNHNSKYNFEITADRRIYEDLRRGHVTLRFPKSCKKCKKHREKIKKTKGKSRPGTQNYRHDRQQHVAKSTSEPRYTLASPVDWQHSPLLPPTTEHASLSDSNYFNNYPINNMLDNQVIGNENTTSIVSSSSNSTSPYIVVNIPANTFNETGNRQIIGDDTTTVVSDEIHCRYCLGTYNSYNEKEKLISPCQCSGSSKFVHKTCLEKWLTLRNTNHCEVCRTMYDTKWIYVRKRLLHFEPMEKRDIFLLFLTISLYVTLIFQLLGAVYVAIMADVLPIMMRVVTLFGLCFGLFWFMIGCITLTILMYNSDYWKKWRSGRRRKVLVLNGNFNENNNHLNAGQFRHEETGLMETSSVRNEVNNDEVNLDGIDYSRPVPV